MLWRHEAIVRVSETRSREGEPERLLSFVHVRVSVRLLAGSYGWSPLPLSCSSFIRPRTLHPGCGISKRFSFRIDEDGARGLINQSPRSRGRRQAESTANAVRPPMRPAARPLADATACTPRFLGRGYGSQPHPRPARPCLRPLQGRHRMGATAGLAMRALAAPERGARPHGCCLPAFLPACVAAVRWWLEYPRPPTMPHCVPTTALIARALRTLPVLLSAERQAHPRSISLKPCLPRRTTTPPRPRRRS